MHRSYDIRVVSILAELRERVGGLSQQDAAEYFGYKSRDTVSAWETGKSRCQETKRQIFILYLLDKLLLRNDPIAFLNIWSEVLVKQWGWGVLTEEELRNYFPSAMAYAQSSIIDHASTVVLVEDKRYKTDWIYAYPAHYFGEVWVRISTKRENLSLTISYSLKWGPWLHGGHVKFGDFESLYLLHFKADDGLSIPLFLHSSLPVSISYGTGSLTGPNCRRIDKDWILSPDSY